MMDDYPLYPSGAGEKYHIRLCLADRKSTEVMTDRDFALPYDFQTFEDHNTSS